MGSTVQFGHFHCVPLVQFAIWSNHFHAIGSGILLLQLPDMAACVLFVGVDLPAVLCHLLRLLSQFTATTKASLMKEKEWMVILICFVEDMCHKRNWHCSSSISSLPPPQQQHHHSMAATTTARRRRITTQQKCRIVLSCATMCFGAFSCRCAVGTWHSKSSGNTDLSI